MSDWHKLTTIIDVPPGTGREFTVAGRIVALFNLDGHFHALDGLCAHQGGPLAKGAITGDVVTCPWHGWQYDITTGHHCLNPRISQSPLEIKVDEDAIWVRV